MNYNELAKTLEALIQDNEYDMTILANSSALLYNNLENLNWVGFYINKNETLLLGPFQGKVACTTIPFSKGVCGKCASTKETVVVDDVLSFKGHIACDSASRSEICVPLIVKGQLYGLLDIDSPITNRFSNEDKIGLEKIAKIIMAELEKIVD